MPRRRRPLQLMAIAGMRAAVPGSEDPPLRPDERLTADVLRAAIEGALDGKALRRWNAFSQLDDVARDNLVDDLMDAVNFATTGLEGVLSGKDTKPAAWGMDIFVRDVCGAMRHAGMHVAINRDPDASLAQSLAREVAKAVGNIDKASKLRGGGNLFKQMQRAKQIS